MTFATFSDQSGRLPINVLELDLDGCARRYGISPCAATLALQNYTLRSQEIDNAAHTKTNVTVVANGTLGDDGTMTADKIEETAVTSNHQIFQTISSFFTVGRQYTTSAYVRKQERTRMMILFFDATVFGGSIAAQIDLDSLTITGVLGTPDSFGIRPANNGLYRVWVTATALATGSGTPHISLLDDSGASSYLGVVGNGIDVWGWQTREGATPGKYQVTTSAVVDGMGIADDLCFNTFQTCQDTANYLKEVRTLRFCDRLITPLGLIDAYPAITGVRYGATKIDPGGGFSVRGNVTISLQDFTHNDIGVDNYAEERTYDASERGSFFSRLKTRSPFYIGRPMRVLEGYGDQPFSLANFRTREYIIEEIVGPDAKGKVQIKGKDILALGRDDRAVAPTASTNTLRAAMTAGQITLLPQTGEAVGMLAGDKHVRIDDEIILLVSESPTDTLNVTRAQGGTIAAAHNIDASVQECLTFENTPVIDIVQDLLENFAGVDPSFIPFTDWETEETESLSGYDLETIISEPTGVQTLLKEITAITLLDIWYSDVDQEIKLKLQTPFTAVTQTVDDDSDILMDSVKLRDLNKQRLTRVIIYYGIRNFARDLKDAENYEFVNFEIEADKEGVNKFNDEKIKRIFSRWMDASNKVQVQLTSTRLLDRYGNTPIELSFNMDAKDVERLQTGDVFDVNSRSFQNFDGSKKVTRFQVIETAPLRPSSQYKYKCLAFFQDPTPETLTVTVNKVDFDLFVELGGPPQAVDVTVTINAGVDIDGSNGNPAFKTAGMHPDSTLTLINNGEIRGYGGNGGKGDDANVFGEPEEGCTWFGNASGKVAGQDGGDALDITIDVTIDNTNGNIFAGAGAGGGGDGFSSNVDCVAYGGGGGGGGLGTDTGNAGSGGVSTANCPGCGPEVEGDGAAGVAGSVSAGGTGGLKGGTGAGDGGDGGTDWGEDGQVGGSGGAGGGSGGFAVRLNGNMITWTGGNTPAKVKGDVA